MSTALWLCLTCTAGAAGLVVGAAVNGAISDAPRNFAMVLFIALVLVAVFTLGWAVAGYVS